MKNYFLYSTIVLLLFSSCISQRRVKYLQDTSKQDTTTSFQIPYSKAYKIQAGDNLYIRIVSLDEKTNNVFNLTPSNNNMTSSGNDASLYITSYTVDVNGYIMMPILGNVYVKDKSLDQIKTVLQESVNEYLNGSTVIVKLVSFNFTVLGEVRKPGRFPVFQDKINLFEAIGLAGDLTPFGNRRNVKLIRENNGKTFVYVLSLTDKKVLESEFYYLKPNDIIYIEPMKGKVWAFEAFPYTLIFSTITTTLLILNFIK
ncbi:MAG: polysaccharide biosynthesis/export family protein [Bacteroidetes bacterium]|nr:polysaccharide biosynthesis/export family protein [Bacteroidota bacterium]